MIITVLWEDQRGVQSRGFGPHELLVSCVADRLCAARENLKALISSHPKKGNANVRKALLRDVERLNRSGPVFAVVDRDKIRDLWKHPGPPPANCMSAIALRFRQDAAGEYDLVFLVQNVETLIEAVCRCRGQNPPSGKPDPDLRDRLLAKAVWDTPEVRMKVCEACPSFGRIVTRVAAEAAAIEVHAK